MQCTGIHKVRDYAILKVKSACLCHKCLEPNLHVYNVKSWCGIDSCRSPADRPRPPLIITGQHTTLPGGKNSSGRRHRPNVFTNQNQNHQWTILTVPVEGITGGGTQYLPTDLHDVRSNMFPKQCTICRKPGGRPTQKSIPRQHKREILYRWLPRNATYNTRDYRVRVSEWRNQSTSKRRIFIDKLDL